jgi:hypothetical protein
MTSSKEGRMGIRLLSLALAGTVAYGGASISAHHSFATTYRQNEPITIKGVLVTLVYRNPHSSFEVQAPDRAGRMRLWAVEGGSREQMRRWIVTEDTLKPGDLVIITGDPGRDEGEGRLRLRTIVRPSDGWRWSEGAAARGVGRWGPTSAEPWPGEGPRSKQ